MAGSIPIEKIVSMLGTYREKLQQAETPPIDYAMCIRLSAQIGLLEDLFYYAHVSAQSPDHETPDVMRGQTLDRES